MKASMLSPNQAAGKVYLCPQDSIVEGGALGFDPHRKGRDTLLVVRWKGALSAWRNLCPHLDVAMQYRKDRFMSADGQHIVCYAHGALFRPDSGVCVLGPCLGQSLQRQTITVDEQGGVWLCTPSACDLMP
jgi:nitrite reductase/ring-hydroxylating ferredoxin subunit